MALIKKHSHKTIYIVIALAFLVLSVWQFTLIQRVARLEARIEIMQITGE